MIIYPYRHKSLFPEKTYLTTKKSAERMTVTSLQIIHSNSFLRKFLTKEHVMRLSDEEIASLREASEQGDVYAKYGYGRWLYYRNPYDGAISEAERLFYDTKETLADSLAAYALMLRFGEAELTHPQGMDVELSHQLLQKAIYRGSELADLQSARFRIFGIFCQAEPEAVASMIEQRLHGFHDCDPAWHGILAFAYEELGRQDDAIRLYEQAIKLGELNNYLYLANIYSERGDTARYEELMEEGIRKGSGICMMYQRNIDSDDFDALSADEQQQFHRELDEQLHRGLQLGEGVCAYYLWMFHHYGTMGYEEDVLKATAYLLQGVRLGHVQCISQLAEEAEWDCLPKGMEMSETEIAELRLQAARYSPTDKDVLRDLSSVDDPAFLLKHKEEMERYWQPLFQKLTVDEQLDTEYEDDDGRYDPWA